MEICSNWETISDEWAARLTHLSFASSFAEQQHNTIFSCHCENKPDSLHEITWWCQKCTSDEGFLHLPCLSSWTTYTKILSRKPHQIRNVLHWYLHCGWATLQDESLQKWLNSKWDAYCDILYIYIKLQKSKRVWSRERRMVNWNIQFLPFILNSSCWLFYDIWDKDPLSASVLLPEQRTLTSVIVCLEILRWY